MSTASLPYRIRVPLAALKRQKAAAQTAGAVVAAAETGPMAGETIWSARSRPNYVSLTLTSKVYDVADATPLQKAAYISERLGNGHSCYLKREDLLPGSSFKLRGAYNALYHLNEEEKVKGVVTYSRGAHGRAIALAAQKIGVPVTIVMPTDANNANKKAVERLGCTVLSHGSTPLEASAHAKELAEDGGLVFLPAFDHPYMIAGQGTVAMEVINQHRTNKLDAIFCSVGGGDLIAGVSAYVKQVCPEVKVIGVEAEGANTMERSLDAGYRVTMKEVSRFADSAAVSKVGEESFRVCDESLDDMVVVSNDEICSAIKDAFEDTRAMLEPAGALAIAGMKKWAAQADLPPGGNFVAVTSDANMKFDQLRFIADRALLGDSTEAMVSVIIPEKAGMFKKLYDQIYPRNVTEFVYRYSGPDRASIFLAFELDTPGDESEVDQLVSQLGSAGFEALNISDNEMAKSHARYLVGGRGPAVGEERLLSFEFPERKGALLRFLQMMPTGLNVSLFHYRNHGADMGRVLCGLQVPDHSDHLFDTFLEELDYPYVDESLNPVYRMFLKPSFRYKPSQSTAAP